MEQELESKRIEDGGNHIGWNDPVSWITLATLFIVVILAGIWSFNG